MRKLMNTIAIIGCTILAGFGMTSKTVAETTVAQNCGQEVTMAYNNLPESVKDLFNNIGCTINEVEEIKGVPESIEGIFWFKSSTNYSAIEIESNIERKDNATYHEFGHMLDYGYDKEMNSADDEFMSIYQEEKASFVTEANYEYVTSNSVEYFAQAFAEYMTNPERLEENTPKTYDYVVNAINNIR